jgi:hypothetical protein
MTSVASQVASVHYDERPHEWRAVHDPRGYQQLVDDAVSPPPADSPVWVRGHRMIVVSEHPYDPASAELTPMLLVAVTADCGAAYVREVDHGIVTGWVTNNPSPIPNAPEIPFASQGWASFPAAAVLTTDQVRALVTEYVATGGQRPSSVAWQASELMQ